MSFFDHFTSIDSNRWGTIQSGSGSITATDGYVELARPSATDIACIYLKAKIDRSKAQLYAFAFAVRSGASATGWMSVVNSTGTPAAITLTDWSNNVRTRVDFGAISSVQNITFRYRNTSNEHPSWDTGSVAWTTSIVASMEERLDDDFYEIILECDPTLGLRWLLVTDSVSGTSYSFNQGGPRVSVLTDWVAWSSLTQPDDDLYIHLGMPITNFITGTVRCEWFRHADGARQHVWANGKDAFTGGWDIRHLWHYGDYYCVPQDRTTLAVARGGSGAFDENTAKDPFVLLDGSTYYMVYKGENASSTSQVGLATATDPNGPWTKDAGNPIVAAPGGNRSSLAFPSIYKDNDEPDSDKRYKMLVDGVSGAPFDSRIFYLTAPAPDGTWTWYDDGGGADNSWILEKGGTSDPDEFAVAGARLVWVGGQFVVLYGGRFSSSLPRWSTNLAYADGADIGSLTKYGSNPIIPINQDAVEGIDADLNGRTATVSSTTGFAADAIVAISQSTSSQDDWSTQRIRKITANTSLELYGSLKGFTTTQPARIRQVNAWGATGVASVWYDEAASLWRMWCTSFAPHAADTGDGFVFGFNESHSLWSATVIEGPWTIDHMTTPGAPQVIFGGFSRSLENITITNLPINRAGHGSLLARGRNLLVRA